LEQERRGHAREPAEKSEPWQPEALCAEDEIADGDRHQDAEVRDAAPRIPSAGTRIRSNGAMATAHRPSICTCSFTCPLPPRDSATMFTIACATPIGNRIWKPITLPSHRSPRARGRSHGARSNAGTTSGVSASASTRTARMVRCASRSRSWVAAAAGSRTRRATRTGASRAQIPMAKAME
jgi:hypothetical protein